MGIDTKNKKGVLLDIPENYAFSALEKVINRRMKYYLLFQSMYCAFSALEKVLNRLLGQICSQHVGDAS